MTANGFRAVSRRIRSERHLKYVGAAQIKLSILIFPHCSDIDVCNVSRLKTLFRTQHGCNPNDLQNRIPAVVDEAVFDQALVSCGVSRESLLAPAEPNVKLEFPEGFHLECLRGHDTVKAAQETLTSTDPRWMIDLFIAGT